MGILLGNGMETQPVSVPVMIAARKRKRNKRLWTLKIKNKFFI
jgi:hypothetical protein